MFVKKLIDGFRDNKSDVAIGAGIAMLALAVVEAIIAGRKVDKEIAEEKKKIEDIKESFANLPEESKPENDPVVDQAYKKSLTKGYIRVGIKVVKVFAPTIALAAGGAGFILAGYGIVLRDCAGLASAYAVLDKTFKEYRKRRQEEEGEDKEKKFYHNLKEETVEETYTDEKGKEKKKKSTYVTFDDDLTPSEFSRVFDGSNPYAKDNPRGYNLYFLRMQQATANARLNHRGWLTLNEVYEMLGFPPVDYGYVIGWRLSNDNEDGDNRVDFGIYNIKIKSNRDFINGLSDAVILDFNVDGDIMSKYSRGGL